MASSAEVIVLSSARLIATELGHALKAFVWDDDMGNSKGDASARQLDE